MKTLIFSLGTSFLFLMSLNSLVHANTNFPNLRAVTIPHSKSGGESGNGGDVIVCRKSPLNVLKGFYTLDYIVQVSSPSAKPSLVPVRRAAMNINRISSVLALGDRDLAASLRDFVNSFYLPRHLNFERKHIWIPRVFLRNVPDESLTIMLPSNCLDLRGQPRLHQAVIRSVIGSFTVYDYSENVFRYLSEEQLSIILVHEWLWQFRKDVSEIRDINWFLHSRMFAQAEAADVQEFVLRLKSEPSNKN